MKLILLIFFILFSKSIFANDEGSSEVEVIDLYESKSLDQMVLENLNVKDETNNDQISDELGISLWSELLGTALSDLLKGEI